MLVRRAIEAVTTIVQKDIRSLADLLRHFRQFGSSERIPLLERHLRNVVVSLFLLLRLTATLYSRADSLDLLLTDLLIDSAALVVSEQILERTILSDLLRAPRSDAGRELEGLVADDLVAWDTALRIEVFDEGLNLLLGELLAGDCFDRVGVFLHVYSVGFLLGQVNL